MAEIRLTEEQANLLRSSAEPVRICDEDGNFLTSIRPLPDPEMIRLAKERAKSPGPWFSTAQVLKHLERLQEIWDKEGEFTKERMHELLHEMQREDSK